MAVARVRESERPSDVIASYGVHRCTIYRWLTAAHGRGHGLHALAARPATGRPRTLTARQERQVFRGIKGKNLRPYGFEFGLWTRQIVRELMAQRFSVRVEPGLDWCLARATRTDAAEALATGVSAGSRRNGSLAA